jgi:hypothetical protein
MDLIDTLKEVKNLRKTGVPYDSESPAWKTPFETTRKKWDKFQRERPLRRKPPI